LTLQACHLGCHVLALDLGEEADMGSVFNVLTEMVRGLAPQVATPTN